MGLTRAQVDPAASSPAGVCWSVPCIRRLSHCTAVISGRGHRCVPGRGHFPARRCVHIQHPPPQPRSVVAVSPASATPRSCSAFCRVPGLSLPILEPLTPDSAFSGADPAPPAQAARQPSIDVTHVALGQRRKKAPSPSTINRDGGGDERALVSPTRTGALYSHGRKRL